MRRGAGRTRLRSGSSGTPAGGRWNPIATRPAASGAPPPTACRAPCAASRRRTRSGPRPSLPPRAPEPSAAWPGSGRRAGAGTGDVSGQRGQRVEAVDQLRVVDLDAPRGFHVKEELDVAQGVEVATLANVGIHGDVLGREPPA